MSKTFLGKGHLFEVRTGQWKLCPVPNWILRSAAELGKKNRVGSSSSGMVQRGAWLSYSWAQEEGREFITSSWKTSFSWLRERKGGYSNKGVCSNINSQMIKPHGFGRTAGDLCRQAGDTVGKGSAVQILQLC